jgi:hypothetical protein
MYKEFRDVTLTAAVSKMCKCCFAAARFRSQPCLANARFADPIRSRCCSDANMSSLHRARKSTIQIVRTAVVSAKKAKRAHTLEYIVSAVLLVVAQAHEVELCNRVVVSLRAEQQHQIPLASPRAACVVEDLPQSLLRDQAHHVLLSDLRVLRMRPVLCCSRCSVQFSNFKLRLLSSQSSVCSTSALSRRSQTPKVEARQQIREHRDGWTVSLQAAQDSQLVRTQTIGTRKRDYQRVVIKLEQRHSQQLVV